MLKGYWFSNNHVGSFDGKIIPTFFLSFLPPTVFSSSSLRQQKFLFVLHVGRVRVRNSLKLDKGDTGYNDTMPILPMTIGPMTTGPMTTRLLYIYSDNKAIRLLCLSYTNLNPT